MVLEDQFLVERLHEARVRNGGREAVRGEFVGRLFAFGETGAERQQRDLLAFADDAALADLQGNADLGHFNAAAFATRITQRARTVVDGNLGRHHVDEFGFVGRRHLSTDELAGGGESSNLIGHLHGGHIEVESEEAMIAMAQVTAASTR